MELSFESASDRRQFALRYCLWAIAIAIALSTLMPAWSMRTAMSFALAIAGPALAPTLVAAALITVSARFASMGWIMAIACLMLVVEIVIVLWLFAADGDLGYSMLYLLPVAAGFPLTLVAYLVAGWRRLRL